ncbi:uncharacterized protein LOC143259209 [Megalopta genalis]|uniref:uncharacterized protein LOC143259209 n=1 Tax=Megalopta genalis TaxID=115081 RepID=UPI003FCFF068
MGNSKSRNNSRIHARPHETQHVGNVQRVPPTVSPPQPFLTLEEFFENWSSWKQNFLKYKASMPRNTESGWENTLLNLMGPIGQDIYTTIKSPYKSEHLDALLIKFDEYSIFKTKRRLPRENVYEYIDDLQTIVRSKNFENIEPIIKQRILSEIDEAEFTTVAKTFMPKFIFASAYNKLMLKEIAFLWDFYISQRNCKKCGNDHEPNKCPAIGKQCQKCNKFDHYNRRCPLSFMFECKYCGGSHFIKKCPAYNAICTECQRLNHFSWKCQTTHISECHFCGMSHAASRSSCPGNNAYCIYCQLKGHFSSKCKRRPRPCRN